MAKRKRKYKYVPAIEDATARDKGVVVSAQRAKWKAAHWRATPAMIRMVRFVWMRDLYWEDKHKLHGGVLGACMRAGMIWRQERSDRSTNRLFAIDPRHLPGYEP